MLLYAHIAIALTYHHVLATFVRLRRLSHDLIVLFSGGFDPFEKIFDFDSLDSFV